MSKIPVALFCYNRPKHLLNSLKSILDCPGREHFVFYFFSDGPKNTNDSQLVEEVRKILKIYAPYFSANLHFRAVNLGLAQSIVTEVSTLCSTYGTAVVLEDDLTLEAGFFDFMHAGLNFYHKDKKVMQVGACSLWAPENWPYDAYFLPVTTTWGWGTWKRAWDSFSWMPEGWPSTRNDETWFRLFTLSNAVNFELMLEHQMKGLIDSWGVLWWYAVSRLKGQVIYPTQSLVINHGLDGSGVHMDKIPGGSLGKFLRRESNRALKKNALKFPLDTTHRPEHLFRYVEALKQVNENKISEKRATH